MDYDEGVDVRGFPFIPKELPLNMNWQQNPKQFNYLPAMHQLQYPLQLLEANTTTQWCYLNDLIHKPM